MSNIPKWKSGEEDNLSAENVFQLCKADLHILKVMIYMYITVSLAGTCISVSRNC